MEYRIKLTPDMDKFTCEGKQEVDVEVSALIGPLQSYLLHLLAAPTVFVCLFFPAQKTITGIGHL